MSPNIERRLTKIEKDLAKSASAKVVGSCNCGNPERIFIPRPGIDLETQLRAELDLTCPCHRERILNRLLYGVIISSDGKPVSNTKMDPIVEEYERRYDLQLKQSPEK